MSNFLLPQSFDRAERDIYLRGMLERKNAQGPHYGGHRFDLREIKILGRFSGAIKIFKEPPSVGGGRQFSRAY